MAFSPETKINVAPPVHEESGAKELPIFPMTKLLKLAKEIADSRDEAAVATGDLLAALISPGTLAHSFLQMKDIDPQEVLNHIPSNPNKNVKPTIREKIITTPATDRLIDQLVKKVEDDPRKLNSLHVFATIIEGGNVATRILSQVAITKDDLPILEAMAARFSEPSSSPLSIR